MVTTFLPVYRKAQTPEQTHFCPGCGHGNVLKLVDEAICALGLADKAVWISPVGCGGLTDSYLSISHILSAHGRASAVATSFKRLHPDALVIVSQGDGDLASIGLLEAIHAANRGENLTVLFINNANFAMTGGQMAPTTPLGQRTPTSPDGRTLTEHGAPIKVCEILCQLDAPALIARVAIGSEKQIAEARKVIRKAIQNQAGRAGYSFVEILSPCPSNWHCSPAEARDRVASEMTGTFPLGVFRDVDKSGDVEMRARPAPYRPGLVRDAYEQLARPISISERRPFAIERPVSLCCAGSGGQGVLTLGKLIVQLALASGLEATWIPSYGPEMRGGTANCFVRISSERISSPVVDHPDVVFAMNQPALDAFSPRAACDGVIFYDSDSAIPADASRRFAPVKASSLASDAGAPKSANLFMLAAWLQQIRADRAGTLDALETILPKEACAIFAKAFTN